MQRSFEQIEFLVGDAENLENARNKKALPIFSEICVAFLSALSKKILSDKRTKMYPDLSSYAFWIRKANISLMKEDHYSSVRIGRGVAFHIAPSNVPVAFAMSFTAGLLAGNINIVRISNKQYEQVDIIVRAVKELFEGEFQEMTPYLYLVRYEHNSLITQTLSDLCDIRVIWGGNRTVETIREAKLPPRAVELTFADRYSLAVIDSDNYLKADKQKIAEAFFIDTYYSDQAACSSPRLVFWVGEHIEDAQQCFWNTFENIVRNRYELQDIQCVDKLDAFCRLSMIHPKVRKVGKGLLLRVILPELYNDLMEFKENGGYFFEYHAFALDELVPVLGKPCQTIAYFGIDPECIRNLVIENGVRGVDRIVPLGQTMELSLIWDGFDLVESMSRIIELKG